MQCRGLGGMGGLGRGDGRWLRDGRPRREQTAARETHEFRRKASIESSKRKRRRQERGEQERGELRVESTVESKRAAGKVESS